MDCVRTPIKAKVEKYQLNASMEDGFELYSEIITMDFVDHSNLIQVEKGGNTVCPYIRTRRGKTFIKENDYIVIEEDGTKVVCGEDKVFFRYAEV